MLEAKLEQVRAFWLARQGLAGDGAGDVVATVQQSGWVRTVGGVEAYLAIRARRPQTTRAEVDAAVGARELQVLPAARSCMYVVPRADAGVALALAASLARPRTEKEVKAVGAKPSEVNKLAKQVLEVLATPLTTDGIRKALPSKAVKSLGPAGKKVGLSSLLPVALRELEFRGDIARVTETGRLDTERYLWRRSEGPPLPKDPVATVVARALSYMAPLTLKELADFVGVSQRDARAALASVDAAAIAVDGYAPEAWLLTTDVDALLAKRERSRRLALLPADDNLFSWRGGGRAFADPKHHARLVHSWGATKPQPLAQARHLGRSVVHGDRLLGFWEADVARGEAVFDLFDPPAAALRKELAALGKDTVRFLRDDVGHARTFSLDTDEQVAARAAALRG